MENVLGRRMIDEGLVTAEQLEKALDTQKSTRRQTRSTMKKQVSS